MDGLDADARLTRRDSSALRVPVDRALRPMTATEYSSWLDAAVASFARETAIATDVPIGVAMADSAEKFQRLLPAGPATPGHRLWCVTDRGAAVGTLWLGPHPERSGVCWIYDIVIDPRRRSQGLGARALSAAEKFARGAGYTAIGLNVFDHNPRARALYERMGYRSTVASEGRMTMNLPLADGS